MSASTSLAGLRVAAFESRQAGPMAELIRKQGGVPVLAPALREVPLEENQAAIAFADRLRAGGLDLVVFLTGVGTRYLAQILDGRMPRVEWVAALERAEIVVRGPKPLTALRELGIRADLTVPEPNTWHEILATLDDHLNLAGLRVAVQEYGKANPELLDGLRQRGRWSRRCRFTAGPCPRTPGRCDRPLPFWPRARSAPSCSPRPSRSSTSCKWPPRRPSRPRSARR